MTPAMLLAFVAVGGTLSCATTPSAAPTHVANVDAHAAPVVHAAEPDARIEASAGISSDTAAALRSWEIARIDALLACAQGQPCSQPAAPHVDDAALRTLLTLRPRDERMRRATASAARVVIESALAADAFDRHARRRALSFVDAGPVGGRALFAYDDVATLLAQAKRDDRSRLLAASRTALERSVDIAAEERALLEAAARRLGMTRGQLLAKRAGLDEAGLRALVGGALAGTAPLLSAVASDVTLVTEVRALSATASDPRAARSLASAARTSADPILVEAAARAALAPKRSAPLTDWTRVLAVDARVAALSVLALLDGADADTRDALASRILDNDADVVRGAGALLTVDEGGVVIERFVSLLSTPALARDVQGGMRADGDKGWIRAWLDAPPLEERGHPEAFIEVLKVLPELAAE